MRDNISHLTIVKARGGLGGLRRLGCQAPQTQIHGYAYAFNLIYLITETKVAKTQTKGLHLNTLSLLHTCGWIDGIRQCYLPPYTSEHTPQ